MSALNVLAAALLGLATSTVYGLTLYYAGRLVTGRAADGGLVSALVSIGAGAAVFALAFSVLGLAGLTPTWLVIALPGAVLAYGWRRFGLPRPRLPRPAEIKQWLSHSSFWQWAVYAALLLYVGYAATFTLTPYLGADLAIYHLVIPRDVLRDAGFVYNPFFFAAGIPAGWHMLGLPAYAIAGAQGYLALSFWAFVLTLVLVFAVSRQLLPDLPEFAPIGALIVAYIYVGFSQGSISNNDIAAVFLELLALTIAAHLCDARLSLALGLVGGLVLASKPTALPAVALIFLIYLWFQKGERVRSALVLSAACAPLALVWPLVTLWHSGSPFPQFMNGPRLWGEALPAFADSIAAITDLFGTWYRDNIARFFTEAMIGYSVLLALLPAGLLFCSAPVRRLSLFLLIFALSRFLLLALLARRTDVLFHDRYHVVSYIIIGLAAGCATWSAAVRWAAPPRLGAAVGGWLMVGIAAVGLLWGGTLRDTLPDGTTMISRTPGLLQQMLTQLSVATTEPDHGRIVRYIHNELLPDAVVATTSIAPYALDRRFLQVLSVSQNIIDLRDSPSAISQALRDHGACFLYVPFGSGLNPWANAVVEPWVDRLRGICALPQAQMLVVEVPAPGLKSMLCRLPGC